MSDESEERAYWNWINEEVCGNREEDEYEQDEEEAINRDIEKIKAVVEPFLKGWFGERCPDFDENCLLCKRWQHYDQLIKSPFKE